mgnify:CR=1 FL=1
MRDVAVDERRRPHSVPSHDDCGVSPTATRALPVRARAQRDNAYGIMNITFAVTAVDDPSVATEEDSRFLGPTP